MNKKAIAGILARLDDPDQIETLLELIANKADEPPAATEPSGQLFSITDTQQPKYRKVKAPRSNRLWDRNSNALLIEMLNAGYGPDEIAFRLGRSRRAIDDRLYKMRKGELAV